MSSLSTHALNVKGNALPPEGEEQAAKRGDRIEVQFYVLTTIAVVVVCYFNISIREIYEANRQVELTADEAIKGGTSLFTEL